MNSLPKSPFPPALFFFLDNPLRRLIFNREKFIRGMGIKQGDTVLEMGCGPGFFTETLSAVAGKNGKVYAQDVEEKMLKRVTAKLHGFGFKNVTLLLSNSSSLPLGDGVCDAVFCANVLEEIYHENEIAGTIKEIHRVLKKPGILIIKEHRPGGTRKIIEEVKKAFLTLGYEKCVDIATPFSFHVKFRK